MEDKVTFEDNKPNLDFHKIHNESFVNTEKILEYPPVALSIGDITLGQSTYPIPFGTYGNFSCIVGASKSRKTFLKSLLLASYIGGKANYYGKEIKTHRTSLKYVIDIDTEQGEWHSQRVFKRVDELVGKKYSNYKPFYLRKYSYYERLQFIEWLFMESEYKDNIGLFSIDGIADLVNDVNDLKQSNLVAESLMKWTEVSKCHLITILHKNFGSSKPTGHLGSSVLKKAETVVFTSQDESDSNSINVKFEYTRSFPIEDMNMIIDNNGLPILTLNEL